MRDDFYRNLCDSATEYDRVCDWIAANNKEGPRAQRMTGEEFAVWVVHACIQGVLFGTAPNGRRDAHFSTGMCFAARLSNDPKAEGYHKVILAVRV